MFSFSEHLYVCIVIGWPPGRLQHLIQLIVHRLLPLLLLLKIDLNLRDVFPKRPRLDLILEHLIDLGRGSLRHLGEDIPADSARQDSDCSEARYREKKELLDIYDLYHGGRVRAGLERGKVDLQESSFDRPSLQHIRNGVVEHDPQHK